MRLCFANATGKMAIKWRLSQLCEARDDCLMKAFERVDAESKKFALESGLRLRFGRRRCKVFLRRLARDSR